MEYNWSYNDKINYGTLKGATVEFVLSDGIRQCKHVGKFLFKVAEEPESPMHLFIDYVLPIGGATPQYAVQQPIDPAQYHKIEIHPDSSAAQFRLT